MAALTNNQCAMIRALAENNIPQAKRAAIACMAEDTSKKNEWFTSRYQKVLKGGSESPVEQIPANLQFKLAGSMPDGFLEQRYFLSDREKEIVRKVIRMRAVAEKMEALKVRYSNSLLLHGVSGTGKTELGKYIAYQMNLPFFFVNFSQAIDSYMGSTAKNISAIFSFVKQFPCVLMLDEIDCIAMRRRTGGQTGADGELERTTISIMQELDRLPNSVILIGATNRLDSLDEALIRRFSVVHEVKPCTEEEAIEMMYLLLDDIEMREEFPEEILKEIAKKEKIQGKILTALIQKIGEKIAEETEEKAEN